MPQVAAFAAASISYALGGAAIAGSALGVAGVIVAGTTLQVAGIAAATMALGALQGEPRAEGSATAFRADTDAGIPVAYGRVGTGGVIAYRVAYDATNRYQSIVATVSAGPIQSVVSFAADDEVTTFDGNDKANSGKHSGHLWLKTTLGDQPQTALTSPTGVGAGVPIPDWGVGHKLNGLAAYMMTMFENSKVSNYKGGVVKPLLIIEGVFGWDPRLDSTYPGGSGSCRLLDPSTWVWIEEGAIAALNWAIGRWAGASGGGTYGIPYACSLIAGIGSSIEGIDVASFVNAANVADANGWTMAAYPSTKDDKYAVLTKMLQASGAMPARKAGKISCVSYAAEQASVLSVTAADTAGPVEVSLGQSRLERINTVLPRYWSEDHRWEMIQAGPVSDAAWVTEDREITRSRGLDYPYVPAVNQASQLAYYDIANAREQITGTVPFKPHLRQIEPGDCFTFAEPGFLLSGVKVKCMSRSFDPGSGGVRITFRQETDAKHAAALAITGTAPPPVGPETPPDPFVMEPTGFAGVLAGRTVNLFWRNPTSPSFLNVNWYRASGSVLFADAVLMGEGEDPALGGFDTKGDTVPAEGSYTYWIRAVDDESNLSDPVGPVTLVALPLLIAGTGNLIRAGVSYLTAG